MRQIDLRKPEAIDLFVNSICYTAMNGPGLDGLFIDAIEWCVRSAAWRGLDGWAPYGYVALDAARGMGRVVALVWLAAMCRALLGGANGIPAQPSATSTRPPPASLAHSKRWLDACSKWPCTAAERTALVNASLVASDALLAASARWGKVISLSSHTSLGSDSSYYNAYANILVKFPRSGEG